APDACSRASCFSAQTGRRSRGCRERRGAGFEKAGLEQAFLVFCLAVGAGDDAAADTHFSRTIGIEIQRADGDVEVHAQTGADVAQAASVDAAWLWLQFTDDLHGPHLRRAGDRAAG